VAGDIVSGVRWSDPRDGDQIDVQHQRQQLDPRAAAAARHAARGAVLRVLDFRHGDGRGSVVINFLLLLLV